MDRVLEIKTAYWERALAEAGDYVDVVVLGDDLAGQERLFMSPETDRRLIKPRHRELHAAIKRAAPHVRIFFHSCGAIRPRIPDLIEVGVDILSPVQVSAPGMNPFQLKREFGQDIVFWGGGVDTQRVLGFGTTTEVVDDVRRNIDALAPNGGCIFATVHNIQANMPPENIMAIWRTLRQYGAY
jgi:uroporphyrinogen decarboxylase